MSGDALVAETTDKVVVVVGAGGNIGSHCVPHLGRIPQVSRVVLIDPDVYEPRNRWSQDITARAVGRRKVDVQARRLRRINPSLRVIGIADSVQNVPLTRLRGDVILACLDSREARRAVNQAAFRLGVPWIDAGVEPGGLLARVQVYVPAMDAGPCLECAWDEQDYKLLEQRYICGDSVNAPAPTNAFSSLGALAASLQAIECRKLLDGRLQTLAVGRQILVDALHHNHYVTRLTRNPECRFDHEVWSISRGQVRSPTVTVAEVLALNPAGKSEQHTKALWVGGAALVREMTCMSCGHKRKTLRLQGRLRSADRRCAACGGRMVTPGFQMIDRLDEKMPRRFLRRSLASLGLRTGDVVRVGLSSGEVCSYEIGCDS